eukprot:TRINITY_DN5067_c0_g1_i1.p2 TRINITY_DN5067_c0_g1~~TRINITY_DN5067_c0_g1_i1.p2  ORF type:complete len:250 (+),score=63.08 TRINITY_DN5067_c0_g1_i1:80-829(+)
MADEYVETTLAILKECFVYKIPVRSSAAGYKAQDWNVEQFIWTGRLRVVALGPQCIIRLEDPNTGDQFASCPVEDGSVEAVTDSSRYFVLRIEDGRGRHAFLGMGFTERTDAFDFNAALQDHKRHVKEEADGQTAAKRLEEASKKDYSLKEGQTIRVNVNIKKPVKEGSTEPKKTYLNSSGGGGGFGLLPPPPGSAPHGASHRSTAAAPSSSSDPFGDFTAFSTALPSTTQQAKPASSADPFADWTGFQ